MKIYMHNDKKYKLVDTRKYQKPCNVCALKKSCHIKNDDGIEPWRECGHLDYFVEMMEEE